MDKQFTPFKCLLQLSTTIDSLRIDGQALQIYLSMYSGQEINELFSQTLEQFLQFMKLDKECAEEFKALLSKYSPNFVQKFKKEVNNFKILKDKIDKFKEGHREVKNNAQNGSLFQCSICSKQYQTRNGAYNHQKRQHPQSLQPNQQITNKITKTGKTIVKKRNHRKNKSKISDCQVSNYAQEQ